MLRIVKISLVSLLLLLLYLPGVRGQLIYNITEYNVVNGLAQSQVTALIQDKKGNLWVGTNGGGVNIYNGKEFKVLTKDNGLIDNTVYSILEDSKGNFWFGTNNGICVYNGFTYKNYTTKDNLPHNRVFKLLEAKDGTIWIGTGKGVASFKNNRIEQFNKNEKLSGASVFTMFLDKQNNLWFGTIKNGVFMYDNKNNVNEYTTSQGLNHEYIRTIVQDSLNNIWIGTGRGMNIITPNRKIYKHFITSFSMSTITASMLTQSGKLWFVKYSGRLISIDYTALFRDSLFAKIDTIDKYTEIINSPLFEEKPIYTIIEDKENNIWIGTENGLLKFPPKKFHSYYGTINKDASVTTAYSIFESSNGDIWFGLNKEGILHFKKGKDNALSFLKKSKPIKADKKGDKTKEKKEQKKGKPAKPKNSICGSDIFSIIEDHNKDLWFATWNGVSRLRDTIFYNYTTKNARTEDIIANIVENLTSPITYSLLEDSKNIIWMGTDKGVTQYIDTGFVNFNLRFEVLKKRVIFKVFEDHLRNIWFASDSGAFLFNRTTLKHFTSKEGFVDDKVTSVVQDKQNNYWFATKQGIFRYDSKKFDKIDRSDGLCSSNIYSLIFDNYNNLFIGTPTGLDRLNTTLYNSSKKIEIKHYENIDGFFGQECNLNSCFKDKEGKLWFGTIKGVSVYDSKYDKVNYIKPATLITNIKQAFKEFDWSPYSEGVDSVTRLPRNLVLPYDKNHLTFEFVATSLTIPEKVKYQFMLEGLDDDWLPPRSKSEAEYPSLPPGEYTFKARACNNDGVWNETPTTFSFVIKPPFWKTWWFYSIIGIVLIVLIVLYIKWREAKLRKDKAILEQIVKERTAEVVKQKEIVEQKNKDITDSINYAKNIQEAILTNVNEIKKVFPQSFILYKPRDIVSGDFYWFNHKVADNKVFFAAADCTGHGVPGAFMSMLGVAFLNEVVTKTDSILANEVLNRLRDNIIKSLHQTGKSGESKDGMDLALCVFDQITFELQYSGANNPLYIIPSKTSPPDRKYPEDALPFGDDMPGYEIKADKMPIGFHIRTNDFSNHSLQLYDGDTIYIFSDGYADQFGGPKEKKFKYKQLKELLCTIYIQPMEHQKQILDSTMYEWRGPLEQFDDILVMGVLIEKAEVKSEK